MFNLCKTLTKPVVAATFMASIVTATSALAAETPAPAAPQAAPHVQMHRQGDSVEAKIAELRKKLHITQAQTAQWDQVAQTMRDNTKSHTDMIDKVKQNEKTMTAAEDLNAYAEIAQNHADGVKKLAAAFGSLYGTLSETQKKAADDEFREHKRRVIRHHRAMHSQQ